MYLNSCLVQGSKKDFFFKSNPAGFGGFGFYLVFRIF